MSEVKWIKITTDMFDNRKIKHLRRLPDGNSIVLIWVMLLTLAGRCNAGGMIFLTETIPYTAKMLADELGFEETTVTLAVDALKKLGMIQTDGFLQVSNWEKYQNVEGMESIREQTRMRVAKHREKKAALPCNVTSNVTGNVTGNVTVTPCNATDIDKDIDRDRDKDKEKEIDSIATTAPAARAAAVSKGDVNAVAEAWNELGLGQVQKILPDTERGRLLKKRLQDYGLDAVLKAIRNVGESSFLRGGGGKGWVCTFDWLIKPGNFAKVLEGNYADGAATAAGKKVMSAAEYNSRAAGPVNTRDLEKAYGG